jgi:hypothetical protein
MIVRTCQPVNALPCGLALRHEGTLTQRRLAVAKAYLLADEGRRPLKVEQSDGGLVVALPEKAPDAVASVVAM